MTAGVYTVNFNKVRKNVDWYQVFRLTSDGTLPVTLVGATLKMQVRPVTGGPPVLDLSLGSGLMILDAADGRFAINVDHTLMETVPVGTYSHDLVLDRSGFSQLVWEGKAKIKPGVTDI